MVDLPREPVAPPAPGAAQAAAVLPASALRLMLQGLQEIAGPQYEHLLISAGLDEYRHALPPDDGRPALTRAGLVRLNQTVYQMLGEPLTRLFYRNMGTASAAAFERSPLVPQISGLAKVYGQRVRVREIECAAQGAPHCRYAVDKHH